ncbi:MAG: hypothetical protein AAF810_21060, partial [Cyanobacteria bacterium P01_D01_bin.36]
PQLHYELMIVELRIVPPSKAFRRKKIRESYLSQSGLYLFEGLCKNPLYGFAGAATDIGKDRRQLEYC